MENWQKNSLDFFESYVNSFSGLTPEQQANFQIKKDHSLRVAAHSDRLARLLNLSGGDYRIAWLSALLHDIGRFRQLVEFNTFNDAVSVDHAEYSLKVLRDERVLHSLDDGIQDLMYAVIFHHNKRQLPGKIPERELLLARLLRDADKLDILKVVTDYYSQNGQAVNHTLTWELPSGNDVSPKVAKEVLAGKLVSKEGVKNEVDVKIMQLSWVYDLNFKPSFDYILKNRLFEMIYNTLPKKDLIIDIYRKVKVFAENKILE